MKKSLVVVAVIMLCFCLFMGSALACTDYYVKNDSGKIYMGRNWDWYPDSYDIAKVSLHDAPDDGLTLKFWSGNVGGFLASSVNSAGLFMNCNEVGAIVIPPDLFQSPFLDISQLREQSANFTSVQQVKEYIGDQKVACLGYPEQVFLADKFGSAMAVETDNINTYLIEPVDPFLIVTNFQLFKIGDISNYAAAPCARYRNLYPYMNANAATFNYANAVAALKLTAQDNVVKSMYSYVSVPDENAVYLFIQKNFYKTWKISFDDRKIVTYAGFDGYAEFPLNEFGIQIAQLEAMSPPSAPPNILTDFTLNNGILTGLTVGGNVLKLTRGITLDGTGTLKVLTKDGGATYQNMIVGTGIIVQVLNDRNTVVNTLTTVVYGDTTGDGAINALDLLSLKKHVLKQTPLEGAFAMAGNVTKDAQGAVSVLDLLALKKHLLGQVTIVQ